MFSFVSTYLTKHLNLLHTTLLCPPPRHATALCWISYAGVLSSVAILIYWRLSTVSLIFFSKIFIIKIFKTFNISDGFKTDWN
ncbi:hypothetical protein B9Z55_023965 [Caenorhabditis nigoni]|uniref:Uncharacterized protein n=1 Tax=Caenorhabditis nigoni TaxID=1611254 RepID=A0A2G5SSG6_9PELO|nr:hypothetical protein B9Z55_023965 [Caenorhabditis nigoni]